jgi:hypothetical protein
VKAPKTDKYFRALKPYAERLGYTFDGLTASNHWRWRNRHGFLVITGMRLRHARGFQNSRKQLRLDAHRRIAIS